MAEELAKYEAQEMALSRDPEEVLQEAKKAAQALTRVLDGKPKKLILNNQLYLELADWELLGRFYGFTAKVTETKPLQFGNVRGWEAHAVILDRGGREVSAADGMCLNDEEKWSSKPKYEYFYVLKDGTKQKDSPPKNKIIWVDNPKVAGKKIPKKERVKVADEPVPFFQLRSMAQTRAVSKALRNVLAWVVVVAGYTPSSAEDQPEMEAEDGMAEEGQTGTAPPGTEEKNPPQSKEDLINDDQKQTILAQLKKKNLALEHLEGFLAKNLSDLLKSDVNAALDWIGKQKAS